MKYLFAAALLSLTLAASGCQSTVDKMATTTTTGPAVTHAELVADHQKMEADHRIMQEADSVMEADHQQNLPAAQAAGITSTQAYKDLEKRHEVLIARHQQVIAQHDAVLKRHAELEANHASGKITDAQMQQDHA